jgi:hypothetical protein
MRWSAAYVDVTEVFTFHPLGTYASAKAWGRLLNATQYQRNPRYGHVYFGAINFSQLHTTEPSSCTYSPDGTVAAFQTALVILMQVAVT